jgi:prevent-host-death family protein
MKIWQVQEAKGRFSELVECSIQDGPQMVTRHGAEAVVVVAADEFRRLSGQTPRLLDCLLQAPRGEPLALDRCPEAIRDLPL